MQIKKSVLSFINIIFLVSLFSISTQASLFDKIDFNRFQQIYSSYLPITFKNNAEKLKSAELRRNQFFAELKDIPDYNGENLNQIIDQVQIVVNTYIDQKDDIELWRTHDHWSSATESIASMSGDCEDITLLKLKLLELAKVPKDILYFQIVNYQDAYNKTILHAIIGVRDFNSSHFILDNLSNYVSTKEDRTDLTPVMAINYSSYFVYNGWGLPNQKKRVHPGYIALLKKAISIDQSSQIFKNGFKN